MLMINLKNIEKTNENILLCPVFNNNQIKVLSRKSTKFTWTQPTIMKALKLKFTCGNNGYDEFLKQKIPLPPQRTLRRRLQMF